MVHVPEALVVVESKPDNEAVGHLEPDVIRHELVTEDGSFPHQARHAQAFGIVLVQVGK